VHDDWQVCPKLDIRATTGVGLIEMTRQGCRPRTAVCTSSTCGTWWRFDHEHGPTTTGTAAVLCDPLESVVPSVPDALANFGRDRPRGAVRELESCTFAIGRQPILHVIDRRERQWEYSKGCCPSHSNRTGHAKPVEVWPATDSVRGRCKHSPTVALAMPSLANSFGRPQSLSPYTGRPPSTRVCHPVRIARRGTRKGPDLDRFGYQREECR